ncbi:MAG: UDP-N-acetyl-D-mannosamine dehydrogenase [Pseudomonas fluorescens]|nr:MAG: UDP-N-acetyl-D-mannosamine dehydrogenase [Pseudomonas fluorescens]
MASHVSVIGLGYMGLPMAAILATSGHKVTGVDINPHVVTSVNNGQCPFAEPGMPELVAQAHQSGNLVAVTKPVPAEIFILSLPTPVDHTTHEADMSFVEAAAASIAPVLNGGELVMLESTSPMGATRKCVKGVIESLRPDLTDKIDYVFSPERAIPGTTLKEMVGNDRLIGGVTPQAAARAKQLYSSFCTGQLLEATVEEAEMVKVVENASRDVQIAFANELSMVCERLGLDVWRIIKLANHHPRVNILRPGAGVGGHCLAVDPWFIINSAPELTPLMQATRSVNDIKPFWVTEQIRKVSENIGRKPVVACLGLAYKPDVDDLRESPSITVVNELIKQGYELRVVEPHLTSWQQPLHALEDAVTQSDIVVTLTGHKAFQSLPQGALKGKHILDIAGIYLTRPELSQ